MPEDVIEVAAGIIQQEGRILIARRLKDAHLPDLWEFPGGKQNPGETLPECLRREIGEELGLEVEVGPKLKMIEHAYPDRTVRLHFYRCTVLQGIPKALAHQAFQWVLPSELTDFKFPEANRPLILELLGYS